MCVSSTACDIFVVWRQCADTKPYSRPARPCPYCRTMQIKLSRHLFRKHRREDCVEKVVDASAREKRLVITQLRRKGIYEHNRDFLANEDESFMRERRMSRKRMANHEKMDETKLVKVCTKCQGFFDENYIRKHRAVCGLDDVTKSADIKLSVLKQISESDRCRPDSDFAVSVLSKMKDDQCGNLARNDEMIVEVGLHYYRKNPKKDRHLSMTHMRRLSTLLLKFRELSKNSSLTGVDMLDKNKFECLRASLDAVCCDEEKFNLKLALGYLLKKAAGVMQGVFLTTGKEEREEGLRQFLKVLDYHWGEIFNSALFRIDKRRQEKLRKPGELPLETDLQKLNDFCMKTMNEIATDQFALCGIDEFRKLRACIVTRLTVFNSRRGGEPARLELSEWNAADNGEWIDPQLAQTVSPDDQEMLAKYKLAYQSGKGNKDVVPLLIPMDCVVGIRKLMDMRAEVGISDNNKYVFPYSQQSLDHVCGWKEMKSVCKLAGVVQPQLINANKIRHRAATIHAGLAASEQQRKAFFRHMGHSQRVDEQVYQCPLAVDEVRLVGRYLESIDNGGVTGN